MDEFIKKEIEDIKLMLDLIIQQNCELKSELNIISTALLGKNNNGKQNKAVEEFLNNFMKSFH